MIRTLIIRAEEAKQRGDRSGFDRAFGEYCGVMRGVSLCFPNRRWDARSNKIYHELVEAKIIKPDEGGGQ